MSPCSSTCPPSSTDKRLLPIPCMLGWLRDVSLSHTCCAGFRPRTCSSTPGQHGHGQRAPLPYSATFLTRGMVGLPALGSSGRGADEGEPMARPPLSARPPTDAAEERTLRRLANAPHQPASPIPRAPHLTARRG